MRPVRLYHKLVAPVKLRPRRLAVATPGFQRSVAAASGAMVGDRRDTRRAHAKILSTGTGGAAANEVTGISWPLL